MAKTKANCETTKIQMCDIKKIPKVPLFGFRPYMRGQCAELNYMEQQGQIL